MYALMESPELPQGGRYAHDEKFEKRPVKDEYMVSDEI
jgi:hypothetical protein